MGKISPVSSKYIIHSTIDIEGVVDRPDVIGAIFGQTEGLLGAELELRELQRSGRIGRIEVNVDTKTGKTKGTIIVPSSLDKAETSIVGAALEIIQRIGPCNAKIAVQKIEDVRISKRAFVVERAKELLKTMMEDTMPDSQELADEVAYSVRVMEITEYGNERLPAGPAIEESDEVIIVEGRADVLNLLKHGFKNAIAVNGTSVPQTIIDLSKRKVVTAFVDGDRGGNLILKELFNVADVDYVTRAPAGQEVEEISKKEIHKAIRSRVSAEQAKLEIGKDIDRIDDSPRRQIFQPRRPTMVPQRPPMLQRVERPIPARRAQLNPQESRAFKGMLESLIGTRGAQLLDEKLNVMGKVPISELSNTIASLGSGVYAVVLDGTIERDLVSTCEKTNVQYIIGMDSKVGPHETRINILTAGNLQ
ncbi:MAG TPA: DNA primase DnaG [Candidatus Nanoarchaeia archaeon]|nr:DNA primase DnaG [Candidatus Nanoarchaeia archaeon]